MEKTTGLHHYLVFKNDEFFMCADQTLCKAHISCWFYLGLAYMGQLIRFWLIMQIFSNSTKLAGFVTCLLFSAF